MTTLFSLAEDVRKCTACPLWKGTTLAVPGDGAKDAKIMVIGEAPGEEEDRCGLPFAGRAGKYLDKMFELAGFDRKQVFLTNVVKHRPPQNRTPKSGEIKLCKELWLDKQIEIIKPKLIILLGAVALKALTNETSVEKLHGKFIEKNAQKFFVTYLPSAAPRYPKLGKAMETDFKKLKQTLDQ